MEKAKQDKLDAQAQLAVQRAQAKAKAKAEKDEKKARDTAAKLSSDSMKILVPAIVNLTTTIAGLDYMGEHVLANAKAKLSEMKAVSEKCKVAADMPSLKDASVTFCIVVFC